MIDALKTQTFDPRIESGYSQRLDDAGVSAENEEMMEKGLAGFSKIRVLVVEDFLSFRQFICSMLEKNLGLLVVGESSDGMEAVQKAQELKPDVILLDIGLPTQNGLDAARQIRELCPESKIIFVTQESSVEVVKEAMALGARGYVFKTHAAKDLLPAVDAVVLGKQFVSVT